MSTISYNISISNAIATRDLFLSLGEFDRANNVEVRDSTNNLIWSGHTGIRVWPCELFGRRMFVWTTPEDRNTVHSYIEFSESYNTHTRADFLSAFSGLSLAGGHLSIEDVI